VMSDETKNLPLITELISELLGDGVQVLLFVQGIPEKLAKLGIHSIGIVIPEKPEAGIDFLLQQLPIDPGKGCKDLDQCGKKIGGFAHRARAPHQAAEGMPDCGLNPSGSQKNPLNPLLSAA